MNLNSFQHFVLTNIIIVVFIIMPAKMIQNSIYVIICIFQISDETESYCIYVLPTCVFFTWKCLLIPLTVYFWVILSFLMIFKSSLDIVINHLLVIHVEISSSSL